MYHFTYQTKNHVNGKTYVGVHSTENVNDGYLGSGVTLKHAINKHGKANFSTIPLAFFDSAKEAYEEEEYLVTVEWCKTPSNYNARVGGNGTHAGYKIEDTSKMNKASIGIARSEKTKAQIKATMTGRKYSPERRKAISEGKLRANKLK